MKIIKWYVMALILVMGCWSKPKKMIITKVPLEQRLKKNAENDVNGNEEKIFLLSTIYKIPTDTISLILKDYYTYNGNNFLSREDSNRKYGYENALTRIVQNYSVSKRKAASLIFSFIYEMQSKEDIINEELEKRQDMEDQMQQDNN